MDRSPISFIGTAGWSIPAAATQHFPEEGTHLQRYAKILNCVEINSSFYRSHKVATYERWAASTPSSFKFSVKMPRTITHDNRLRKVEAEIAQFLAEVSGLGSRLGPLLVQLPPSLEFSMRVVASFFTQLREQYAGPIVCEPRHRTWFEAAADKLLSSYHIGRVAADPSVVPAAAEAGGDKEQLVYYRLHGSPRIYWSLYAHEQLQSWASKVQSHNASVKRWIIFDNTAAGCATANALEIRRYVDGKRTRVR